ncbi:MAG: hypothetical protein U0841_03725 [Chloroflexia bacterium]
MVRVRAHGARSGRAAAPRRAGWDGRPRRRRWWRRCGAETMLAEGLRWPALVRDAEAPGSVAEAFAQGDAVRVARAVPAGGADSLA